MRGSALHPSTPQIGETTDLKMGMGENRGHHKIADLSEW